MRFVSMFALGLALSAGTAEARCAFAPFHGEFTRDASTTGDCDARGVSGNLAAGGLMGAAFSGLQIVEKPKHGRLEVRSRSSFGYLPERGYRGPDRFILRICGSSRTGQGCSNLTYNVVVR